MPMKLMTKDMRRRLPPLCSQEKKTADEVPVIAHFFSCVNGAANWYATEFDPNEERFFGFAELFPGCGELGYFSLAEFEELNRSGRFPIPPIERDLHWDPERWTLQDILDGKRP